MFQEDNNNSVYTAEKQSYLSFSLGVELFAVHVSHVVEVLHKQTITFVPKAPAHIQGIINFRGDILPVISTRSKLNKQNTESNVKWVIIILEYKNEEDKKNFGAIVDQVYDVLEIGDDEIKISPAFGNTFQPELVAGVVKREERFVFILDIQKVFELKKK